MKRAIIIVLDSVGFGELPDAACFGDKDCNTLLHVSQAVGGLVLPNLAALGLGNIGNISGVAPAAKPQAAYGRMTEISAGKDTTVGHWEIAGTPTLKPFPTYPHGFPVRLIAQLEQATGRQFLGNYPASGTVIIQNLGEEHVATGRPIIYTSADSVVQIAAHEAVIPLDELYDICQKAREIFVEENGVGRIIARPFIGDKKRGFQRTGNRRDFSLLPHDGNIWQSVVQAGRSTVAIGKIKDIFAGRNISYSYTAHNNCEVFEACLKAFHEQKEAGLIWANFVDFDMLYGHRNDCAGYAHALEQFDAWLPQIMSAITGDDLLFITADHGNDPSTASTDHNREYVPLLVWHKCLTKGFDLGVRGSFADLGATAADYLEVEETAYGRSFWPEMVKRMRIK